VVIDGERLERHRAVSGALGRAPDGEVAALVDHARPLGSGIGGSAAVADVDGVPVFVKRVPLIDLERRPENARSTANLFAVPAVCQYGVARYGSPGFGAWREVAAHELATGWAVAGTITSFPLLHHWRVLPGAPPPAAEHADIEAAVRYWGGSSGVRDRLHGLAEATAGVVLFQELVPHTLADWLATQVAIGTEAVVAACEMVESWLLTDVRAMADQGLVHFDGHFANVLTDGHRLYLADFGLASATAFDLSPPERELLDHSRHHDLAYGLMRLVNWIVTRVCGIVGPPDAPTQRRNAFVRACASGAEPTGAPPTLAGMLRRYAPVATLMNDFVWHFYGTSRTTPYPDEQIARALAVARVATYAARRRTSTALVNRTR